LPHHTKKIKCGSSTVSDKFWDNSSLGGALREEQHYDGRRMLCFSERPATLAAMFSDLVHRFPERPAILEDRTITYRELDGLTRTIATGLSGCGEWRSRGAVPR
jgi:long-chain acyl-CoA synthetase